VSVYPHIAGPELESDPNLSGLLAQLQTRHHDAICGALLYGSCLRSGDIYDGLLDLYLICDSYGAAYQHPLMAASNWLLPPNVFYAENTLDDKTLRSKVTVISLRDFQRGCTRAWFESYIWGRFAQPTKILYSRNENIHRQLENSLVLAARTLLQNSLPALPEEGTVTELWQRALSLSYSTELRSERSDRTNELAQSSRDFYAELTRRHAHSLGFGLTLDESDSGLRYHSRVSTAQSARGRLAWSLRRAQGKLMSIMRLLKALFTYDGGLDYIAWKLERHSGQAIVIPDKVRRAPLIHVWGFFLSLYRRGIIK
jgi:phosphatidate cytidylyltransferase-like protein